MSNFQGRNDHDEQPSGRSYEWAETERDARGRFVGCGNKRGRPRKKKVPSPPPTDTFGGLLLDGLSRPVQVSGPRGPQTMTMLEVFIQKLLNDGISGTSTDRARLLRHMVGLLDVKAQIEARLQQHREVAAPQGWTDELEEQYQAIFREYDGDEEALSSG